MFGAPSEWSLCLQQTDRNSRPLRLHVSFSMRKMQMPESRIKESASLCRKPPDKLGLGPTEGARSCESSSVAPLEAPSELRLRLPSSRGHRRHGQMSANTRIRALPAIYFCQAGVIQVFFFLLFLLAVHQHTFE